MEAMYKEIGSKIRQARKAKGLSTPELANKLNISTGQLSNIENGNYDVFKLGLLERITEELSIPLVELLKINTLETRVLETSESIKNVLILVSSDGSSDEYTFINNSLNSLITTYISTISQFYNNTDRIEKITNHLLEELHFIKSITAQEELVPTM